MRLQVVRRSKANPFLFSRGYGVYSAAELLAAAIANLNEYQSVGIGHDEIDLAMTGSIVPAKQLQALRRQVTRGLRFLSFAKDLAIDKSPKVHSK